MYDVTICGVSGCRTFDKLDDAIDFMKLLISLEICASNEVYLNFSGDFGKDVKK